MMPVRIDAGQSGYDIRTFECVKCDHVHSALVVNDPVKFGSTQVWLAGELRAPE
jgi:hypothetical protein